MKKVKFEEDLQVQALDIRFFPRSKQFKAD